MLSLRHALHEGIDALRANPLRSLLSTLGVVMGVASLTAVLSLGDGVEAFAREQIETTTDLQAVALQPRTADFIDGVRVPKTHPPIWSAADAESLAQALPGVKEVLLQVDGQALLTSDSGRQRGAFVLARLADPDGFSPAAGRDLSADDVRASARVVVIDHALATALAGTAPVTALLGRPLVVQGTAFQIIGIRPKRTAPAPFFRIEVPYGTADLAMLPAREPRAPTMILRAATVESVAVVKARVTRWLRARYPGDTTMATISTQEGRLGQVQKGLLIFKLLMGAVTGISLLVGGVGIMNVLLASVAERTREIGIRKAVGARHRDVLAQFLAESVAITGAGAAAGTVVGVAGAFGVTAVMRAMTEAKVFAGLSLSTVLVAAGAAIVTGLAFGLYPALRAAGLPPIEAIRHE
ncbi:MAG: ABC transporter permease [Gemmatimonadetes bacterium]|nr:ABC transporter permease [Gemmatimonadota bacterium]